MSRNREAAHSPSVILFSFRALTLIYLSRLNERERSNTKIVDFYARLCMLIVIILGHTV